MDGIDRILERIGQDSAQEAEALILQAREEAIRLSALHREQADERRSRWAQACEAALQEHMRRLLSAAALESRNTVLAARQTLVAGVFAEARDQLRSLPGPRYMELLARLAAQAATQGTGEILLTREDRQAFGEEICRQANRRLRERGCPEGLVLSSRTGAFSGGLVLVNGPVETDCTLDALIATARNDLTGEIAGILFSETASGPDPRFLSPQDSAEDRQP